ncbi:hypothetical protein [Streptomyces sp. SM12]|uniref:hypothetical protein n=1 Tax=Streptomyces sp. SM12 TaxID=1071602 RepID=UPI0011AFFA95|nr:hypothetical protein [Streptomyces sp. SM12]
MQVITETGNEWKVTDAVAPVVDIAGRCWKLDEVMEAVNNAKDLISGELGGDLESDFGNLIVNATAVILENPERVDFDFVVSKCYSTDPNEVRDWWSW